MVQRDRRRTATRFAWSVRTRILGTILFVTAIGMTVAGLTTYLVQRDRSLEQIDARLQSRVEAARFVVTGSSGGRVDDGSAPDAGSAPGSANGSATADDGASVATESSASGYSDTRDALEAVLARVLPSDNESSLGIVDGVAAFVPGVQTGFHLEDDESLVSRVTAETADGSIRLGTVSTDAGLLRYIAVPVEVTGAGTTERGVFLTAVDVDAELQELSSSFATYAVVAAAALVFIGLAGWFVAGRLLRPIRRLRAGASRITANDLAERIPVVGRDDVSELTATINTMLDRLDGALRSQRLLLDDVRHELSTPITIVRGHLELLDEHDPAEVEATRALAIDELDRMTGLVADIEFLAEMRPVIAHVRPIDTADLTEGVFEKASVIPGPVWERGEQLQATVPGDAARLTQAWLQLVDNAAKYSPPDSIVRIGSSRGPTGVELWVADRGPGIPVGAERRIFERFGRAEPGRGVQGSGLGLPIVQKIAEAHGGTVSLDTSPAGSRFAIVLPAASAPMSGTALVVDAPATLIDSTVPDERTHA